MPPIARLARLRPLPRLALFSTPARAPSRLTSSRPHAPVFAPLPADAAESAAWGASRSGAPGAGAAPLSLGTLSYLFAGTLAVSFVGTVAGLMYVVLTGAAARRAVEALPLLPGNPLVFLDIADGDAPVGRIILQLRADVAPAAAARFAALARAPLGHGYRNSALHGVERGARVFGGDWYGAGRGGGGQAMRVESWALGHVGPGCLALRTTSTTATAVGEEGEGAGGRGAVAGGAGGGAGGRAAVGGAPGGAGESGGGSAGPTVGGASEPLGVTAGGGADAAPAAVGAPPPSPAPPTPTTGAQFYLTLRATPHFDGVHEVIGHVVNEQGFAVLEFLDKRAGYGTRFREGHDFRIARSGVLPEGQALERRDGVGNTTGAGGGRGGR